MSLLVNGAVLVLQRELSSAEVTPALYVTMEILSNWGNALQVGLTELQFFCHRNKKLYVSPHDLDIRNVDYPGNLGALVNGKVKVSFCCLSSSLLGTSSVAQIKSAQSKPCRDSAVFGIYFFFPPGLTDY